MAADQHQIIQLAEPNGIRLLEGMATRRQVNGMHRAAGHVAHRFPTAVKGIRGHHSAPAAAIRVIIHLILLVGGIVPDLMGLNVDKSTFLGPAQNTLAEHIPQRFREQGHDINSHRYAFPQ